MTGPALAPLTTFKLGGAAREILDIHTEEELRTAAATLRSRGSAYAILGGGSNILVPDAGIDASILHINIEGIVFESVGSGSVRMTLGAGVTWDAAVRAAGERALWGIENLAGIPGTAGGAAVQNIGAYGAELGDVFEYADVIDLATGQARRITRREARFAYRDSCFKHERTLAIVRVAIMLTEHGIPNLSYKDLQRAQESGAALSTPIEVAEAVRAIRARKFPDLSQEGTAGSFFKNPIITQELADALTVQYPELPTFPQTDDSVKISLAWILDRVLSLKGLSVGNARLFEQQPLVIAVPRDARAQDVEELAQLVEKKVFAAIGITIEREVETFTAQKLSTA